MLINGTGGEPSNLASKETRMKVKKFMTGNPVCCTPDTNLQAVARLMVDNDCGAIPVVDSLSAMRPLGIVTDRDIATRTVAEGVNPLTMTAGDVMSTPAITVTEETEFDDCCETMEKHQIRRILVVSVEDVCCGIVAQADIAMRAPKKTTGKVVQAVSQPAEEVSPLPEA
jgi:CBS domain-containing protein